MRTSHPTPDPPETGVAHGLSYALFRPASEPLAGIVICHGAGSAKESHFDFARNAAAHGLAAIAFDARGHGRSEGAFGPRAFDDVLAICRVMREHAPHVALRGSSMGGFCAIHAAAQSDEPIAAAIAICPAPEDFLLRGLRSGRLSGFRADLDACEPWLQGLDIKSAAASLAGRTALLLMHARGDEQVPYTLTEELFEAAGDPKRLLLVPGGHHRSLQHDGEMQAESLRFVERAVSRRAS